MRWVKPLLFLAGLGLLAFIIAEIDLAETWHLLSRVDIGILLIFFIYFLAFLIDTFTWQLTVKHVPLSPLWIYRFFQMRLAGEAFNNITPLAGMGGEVIKAVLLKRYYGIAYEDGVASLILAKTINVLALILFLVIGFWFVLRSPDLSPSYKSVAGAGLSALVVGVGLFFLFQRTKMVSLIDKFFSRHALNAWAATALRHVKAVEDKLVAFYSTLRGRFFCALMFALLNWILGVIEIYYIMKFIGYPVSLVDAWIIEAVAQMVRAGTFLVPASIGVQEGAILTIGAVLTGSPTAGFTAAIIRRVREVIWIAWGIIVFYVLKPDISADNHTAERNSD
ncbi:MAG: hypothetical protein CMM45_10325 [Rhodospirillaceae bacterium]|nr:hypothetical protein [Rhodospirillaceae bacterium]